MTTPSERERAELRIELERVWCSVKTGDNMIDAFTDYVLVQCEAARREERKRCAEKLAEAARKIAELQHMGVERGLELRLHKIEQILTDTLGEKK